MTSEIKLGDNWSVREEDASGDITIRDRINTKDLFEIPTNGPVKVPNSNLQIGTGNAIEDGSGTARALLRSDRTKIFNEAGSVAADFADGTGHIIQALSTTPIQFYDGEGGFTAVQYDTGTSAGVLRTPNAGVRVESTGTPSSGKGLEFLFNQTNEDAQIQSYDRDNNTYETLYFGASRYDFTKQTSNIRLATGQAIEDGSGGNRFEIGNGSTRVLTDSQNEAITAYNGTVALRAWGSSDDIRIVDEYGGFQAVKYKTAASAPGTLELTNTELRAKDDAMRIGPAVESNSLSQLTTSGASLRPATSAKSFSLYFENGNGNSTGMQNESGELIASDSAGNTVTLT